MDAAGRDRIHHETLSRLLLLLVVLGAVGGGSGTSSSAPPRRSTRPRRPAAAGAAGRAGGDPIPVLAATATTGDVPVYLDALGTVQAFNTVSIKPMIDGPLVEVRFKEGQDVRAGDVLARIDSRTYQAR